MHIPTSAVSFQNVPVWNGLIAIIWVLSSRAAKCQVDRKNACQFILTKDKTNRDSLIRARLDGTPLYDEDTC